MHVLFSVGFRTTPMDSTGVSHILEHTVLTGSRRYPCRDPFFKMLNRSLNTFMNALTCKSLMHCTWTMCLCDFHATYIFELKNGTTQSKCMWFKFHNSLFLAHTYSSTPFQHTKTFKVLNTVCTKGSVTLLLTIWWWADVPRFRNMVSSECK